MMYNASATHKFSSLLNGSGAAQNGTTFMYMSKPNSSGKSLRLLPEREKNINSDKKITKFDMCHHVEREDPTMKNNMSN